MPDTPPRVIRRRADVEVAAGQCDCACSEGIFFQQRVPPPAIERLHLSPLLAHLPLADEYRVAFIPSGDGVTDGIAVLNPAAWEILATFAQPNICHQELPHWQQRWGTEAVAETLKELTDLRFLTDPHAAPPTLTEAAETLVAWLHVTDRCNLRCAYCYLPHDRADMSAEVGRAAIDATLRSASQHGYRQIKLKYAGGEPLLRFPFVQSLHQYAQSTISQHALALKGVVLTNGTLLTPPILDTMKAIKLSLMISLDGSAPGHDAQRPYANGKGTFEDVTRAIELALSHQLIPDISITVTSRNAPELPHVMPFILQHDLPFSLNFYRENNLSASQPDLQWEEESLIRHLLETYKVIEANLPRRSLLASLTDRANLAIPHSRTCGVGHSYLVFDHRGRVAKCQMAIPDTLTTIHDPDPLQTIRSAKTGIQNLPVQAKEECRTCQWRLWCTGGCPLHTYRATGRYDLKSPNCRIYKAIYPEIIRLEGLRLLRQASLPVPSQRGTPPSCA